MKDQAKVFCETPSPGKRGTSIARWKYEAVREAILRALAAEGQGITAKELPDLVENLLPSGLLADLGSVSWYTVTVKLDLEVKGLIERVPGSRPQRLRRV